MTYYTFHGRGLALGSVIVVRASNPLEAGELAAEWMRDNKLDPASLECDNIAITEHNPPPQVVYAWNGDY